MKSQKLPPRVFTCDQDPELCRLVIDEVESEDRKLFASLQDGAEVASILLDADSCEKLGKHLIEVARHIRNNECGL